MTVAPNGEALVQGAAAVPGDIALLGFTSVAHFQQAWNLGPALAVDNVAGPITLAAARLSAGKHNAGAPDISANFSAAEMKCHCGGAYAACARVLILRGLLQALEGLRGHIGHPVSIVDAYRCSGYNTHIGSVGDSQHVTGAAADLPSSMRLSVPAVLSYHLFSGIGYGASSGTVQHVDVRHLAVNTTHSSVTNPSEWSYPNR